MYEVTVGEYEDLIIVGERETEAEAYELLGRFVVDQDWVKYPRVTNIGRGERFAVIGRDKNGYLEINEVATEREARAGAATYEDGEGTWKRVTI